MRRDWSRETADPHSPRPRKSSYWAEEGGRGVQGGSHHFQGSHRQRQSDVCGRPSVGRGGWRPGPLKLHRVRERVGGRERKGSIF